MFSAMKDLFLWKPCKCSKCHGKKEPFHTKSGSINVCLLMALDCLLEGLKENWREARCYTNTRHYLLARLYLPLILLNIYRKEIGAGNFIFTKGTESLCKMVQGTKNQGYCNAFISCSHSFEHPENFAFDGTHVKILDYGEEGFENLLIHYGDQIEKLLLSKVKLTT